MEEALDALDDSDEDAESDSGDEAGGEEDVQAAPPPSGAATNAAQVLFDNPVFLVDPKRVRTPPVGVCGARNSCASQARVSSSLCVCTPRLNRLSRCTQGTFPLLDTFVRQMQQALMSSAVLRCLNEDRLDFKGGTNSICETTNANIKRALGQATSIVEGVVGLSEYAHRQAELNIQNHIAMSAVVTNKDVANANTAATQRKTPAAARARGGGRDAIDAPLTEVITAPLPRSSSSPLLSPAPAGGPVIAAESAWGTKSRRSKAKGDSGLGTGEAPGGPAHAQLTAELAAAAAAGSAAAEQAAKKQASALDRLLRAKKLGTKAGDKLAQSELRLTARQGDVLRFTKEYATCCTIVEQLVAQKRQLEAAAATVRGAAVALLAPPAANGSLCGACHGTKPAVGCSLRMCGPCCGKACSRPNTSQTCALHRPGPA